MMKLQSKETQLIGQWITVDNSVEADDVAKRIDELVASRLKKVAESKDGWKVLYLGPNDGRYWVLSYPHSEWHGGGPPALQHISKEQARNEYSGGFNSEGQQRVSRIKVRRNERSCGSD